MDLPLLSVCLITYNHKDYIREAIDGVLMQKTNFSIELIIADDFSTDGTREILIEYKKKHPDLITLILQKKNLGPAKNWMHLITAPNPQVKYIAYFEGDDYWLDPLKLQKQVDFLESNNDYNICFHNVKTYNQNKKEFELINNTRKVQETTNVNDLAKGNFIHTPSVVLRNNFALPEWFTSMPIGDWGLYMLAIKDKKIKKLDDIMAVYRVHNLSVWATKTNQYRLLNSIKSFELILNSNEVTPEAKTILKNSIKDFRNQLPKKKNPFLSIINKINIFK